MSADLPRLLPLIAWALPLVFFPQEMRLEPRIVSTSSPSVFDWRLPRMLPCGKYSCVIGLHCAVLIYPARHRSESTCVFRFNAMFQLESFSSPSTVRYEAMVSRSLCLWGLMPATNLSINRSFSCSGLLLLLLLLPFPSSFSLSFPSFSFLLLLLSLVFFLFFPQGSGLR